MRWNHLLTMGAAASVSVAAERASADIRTKLTRDAAALQVLAGDLEAGRVKDVKAFDARKDTVAAAAGHETEPDTARGLKAAESFGEKRANTTTTGTEQAWTTATDAVRRGPDKRGKVVGGG